jgi:hypothetical protein
MIGRRCKCPTCGGAFVVVDVPIATERAIPSKPAAPAPASAPPPSNVGSLLDEALVAEEAAPKRPAPATQASPYRVTGDLRGATMPPRNEATTAAAPDASLRRQMRQVGISMFLLGAVGLVAPFFGFTFRGFERASGAVILTLALLLMGIGAVAWLGSVNERIAVVLHRSTKIFLIVVVVAFVLVPIIAIIAALVGR